MTAEATHSKQRRVCPRSLRSTESAEYPVLGRNRTYRRPPENGTSALLRVFCPTTVCGRHSVGYYVEDFEEADGPE
jgi:hypothetical protein